MFTDCIEMYFQLGNSLSMCLNKLSSLNNKNFISLKGNYMDQKGVSPKKKTKPIGKFDLFIPETSLCNFINYYDLINYSLKIEDGHLASFYLLILTNHSTPLCLQMHEVTTCRCKGPPPLPILNYLWKWVWSNIRL